MKLIPNNILTMDTKKFVYQEKTILNINCESKRCKSDFLFECKDTFDTDVYSTLIEKRAFASAFLYLLENANFITENNEDLNNLKEDVNSLLHTNTEILKEQAPLLTTIGEYPLFESDNYILRGDGDIKIKEYFAEDVELDQDLKDAIRKHVDDSYNGTLKHYGFGLRQPFISDSWLDSIYKSVRKDSIMVPSHLKEPMRKYYNEVNDEYSRKQEELTEEGEACCDSGEGTQTSDIAPKTGYGDLTKPKNYSILLSGIDDLDLTNKGFLKNKDGQYQRGNYVLIKEGCNFKVVNKNKLS